MMRSLPRRAWNWWGQAESTWGRIELLLKVAVLPGMLAALLTWAIAQEWVALGWYVGLLLLPAHVAVLGWLGYEALQLRKARQAHQDLSKRAAENQPDGTLVRGMWGGVEWVRSWHGVEPYCPDDHASLMLRLPGEPLADLEDGAFIFPPRQIDGVFSLPECPQCGRQFSFDGGTPMSMKEARRIAGATLNGVYRRANAKYTELGHD
jgi:hypothetical protein